jgi:hypothetical protein
MMMLYRILDYTHNRLLGPFDDRAVCVTIRVLIQLGDASFDVMAYDQKLIVTNEFVEGDSGVWHHQPPPRAASRAERES